MWIDFIKRTRSEKILVFHTNVHRGTSAAKTVPLNEVDRVTRLNVSRFLGLPSIWLSGLCTKLPCLQEQKLCEHYINGYHCCIPNLFPAETYFDFPVWHHFWGDKAATHEEEDDTGPLRHGEICH